MILSTKDTMQSNMLLCTLNVTEFQFLVVAGARLMPSVAETWTIPTCSTCIEFELKLEIRTISTYL